MARRNSRPNNGRPDNDPRSRRTIQPPSPMADFIESVMELDRRWFEERPGETEYTRMYHPGEFWPLVFPPETSVTVEQIRPGFRTRTANRPPLNPEAVNRPDR